MLNTLEYGANNAPTLLIVHGLYGSARNWGVIAKRLSDTMRVIAVDMRNHGQSVHTQTHSYSDLAADLAEVIESLSTPVHVIGHSMGGKASMMLSLTRPDLIDRLIVADIAPVTYTHSQMPQITAMRAVDLDSVTRRSDAEAQLAAQGVEPALCSFFTQSLDVPNKRWRLNLETLANEMENIMGFPQIDTQFTGPTLFLTGADSDYVTPQNRPDIKRLFPQSHFAKLRGAGHWLHADKPREFEAAVRAFLAPSPAHPG